MAILHLNLQKESLPENLKDILTGMDIYTASPLIAETLLNFQTGKQKALMYSSTKNSVKSKSRSVDLLFDLHM